MQRIPPIKRPTEGPAFQNFDAFSQYLDRLGLFRMKPGLDRMKVMLSRMDLLRPPFTVVQVAGTNGKGSTSAMLESLARAHGLKTGLHSSPHLVSVRERVRIDGKMLGQDAWTALANTIMDQGGSELSYFEFVTCMAILAFSEAKVAIAVMETGLGGLFDATSALDADMVVFTPFALDHQAVLGDTLQEIAADKAGCIRPGKPVISAPQEAEALAEIKKKSITEGAPLIVADTASPLMQELAFDHRSMRLQAEYQAGNASLALTAWRRLLLDESFSPDLRGSVADVYTHIKDSEIKGLSEAWLPARMQRVPPLRANENGFPCTLGWPHLLLDGAHNPHGMAALGLSLAKRGIAPAAIIFACVADKDIKLMLPHLRSLATGPIFVPPIKDNPRSVPPDDLSALIGLNAKPTGSIEDALGQASCLLAERFPEVFVDGQCKNPLLICGSLYLLGEFFALRPDCLEAPQQ